MSKIILAEQASAPDTPGSGKVAVYANNATLPTLCWKDDAGNVNVAPATVAGVWTPELQFGNAATGITYSARTAYYVRVGNLLFFTADVRLSSKGSATGSATIIGLPVTANGSQGNAVIPVRWTQMTTALVAAFGVITAGTTTISLSGLAAAGTTVSLLTDAAFANNSILQLSGCYVVG